MRTTIDTAARVPAQAWRPTPHDQSPDFVAGAFTDNGVGSKAVDRPQSPAMPIRSGSSMPCLVPSQTASAL